MAGTLMTTTAARPQGGLRVCLYSGAGRLMEKSGVGSAMRHQTKMLLALGSQIVKLWRRPDVVQLNTIFPDSVLVACLARALGIPVVVFAHSTREDFEQSWVGARSFAPLFE